MGLFDFLKKNKDNGPIQYSNKTGVDSSNVVMDLNETSIEADSASADFYMRVEDVFAITGRGVVVTGKIEKGQIAVNDNVKIMRQDGTTKSATIVGIEMFRKLLDTAVQGDNVGLLIKGLQRNEIFSGDIICK